MILHIFLFVASWLLGPLLIQGFFESWFWGFRGGVSEQRLEIPASKPTFRDELVEFEK